MGGCCSSGSTAPKPKVSKSERKRVIKTGSVLIEHIFIAGYAQHAAWLQRFFAEFAAAVEQTLNLNGFERNQAISEMLDEIHSPPTASSNNKNNGAAYINEEEDKKKQLAKTFMNRQWKNFIAIETAIEVDSSRVMIIVGWLRFDKDSSGSLDKHEIDQIVTWLNVDATSSAALQKRIATRFKANNRNSLTFVEFSDEFDSLISWQELDFVFYENAAVAPRHQTEEHTFQQQTDENGEPILNYIQLGEYLFYVQDEQDNCWELAKKILRTAAAAKALAGGERGNRSDKVSVTELTIDKKSFMKFLTNRELNNIIDLPKLRSVYQEMHHPLTHYFISASHNTYLTGHQLTSQSSADMYRKVLLEGCRSVELDCWDGADGRPIVYHGYTLTSKITFESVIDAIMDSGFVNSDFPISLSFDLNISVEQQKVMVEILKQKLGDRLHPPKWFGGDSTVSPDEAILSKLKGKVLLKAKRIAGPPPSSASQQQQPQVVEVSEEEIREASERQREMNKKNQQNNVAEQKFQQHPHLKPMARELSDLIWMEACSFKNFPESTPLALPHQCTSFHERVSTGFINKQFAEYCEYNKRRISRVYPSGSRIDSSNFHPQIHFNAGACMCAMNWQDASYNDRFYKARMRDNGGCGYILKPDYLRIPGMPVPEDREWATQIQIKLSILSGFALPKPNDETKGEIVDPYVRVIVEGPGFEPQQVVHQTKVIDDNGFHPVWWQSDADDVFITIPAPELTTICFQVMDSDVGVDDFLGECFVPVNLMKYGVRCVPLEVNAMKNSTLITKEKQKKNGNDDDNNQNQNQQTGASNVLNDVENKAAFLMVAVDLISLPGSATAQQQQQQ